MEKNEPNIRGTFIAYIIAQMPVSMPGGSFMQLEWVNRASPKRQVIAALQALGKWPDNWSE